MEAAALVGQAAQAGVMVVMVAMVVTMVDEMAAAAVFVAVGRAVLMVVGRLGGEVLVAGEVAMSEVTTVVAGYEGGPKAVQEVMVLAYSGSSWRRRPGRGRSRAARFQQQGWIRSWRSCHHRGRDPWKGRRTRPEAVVTVAMVRLAGRVDWADG